MPPGSTTSPGGFSKRSSLSLGDFAVNVVFRTDASIDIGTGHVMRCLALAEALREGGSRCRFVSRGHEGNSFQGIRDRGFELLELPAITGSTSGQQDRSQYAAWLGVSWQDDAQQVLKAVDGTVDWLVIDHYAIDADWERSLRSACKCIMTIDDLANRTHDCDLLLDQNLGRSAAQYSGLVPADCILLVGPQNALLRPEFAAWRKVSLERRGSGDFRRILISMGGVDKDNVTGMIVKSLPDCPLPEDCEICVVMGAHAPALEEVRELIETAPWKTQLVVDARNMAELLANTDLAIGAAGSSSWERCCLGVPTVCVVLAENQREIASALRATGAALLLSDANAIARDLPQLVSDCQHEDDLLSMQKAAAAITDGKGVDRVVEVMRRRTR